MQCWEELVGSYSRVVDVCSFGRLTRAAEAALHQDLTDAAVEKFATSFLFEPVSALVLVRLLEEDSVWTKPLCDIFNVITLLLDKYPRSVHHYHGEIVLACSVSASARVFSATLRCQRALSRRSPRDVAPHVLGAALRTDNVAREQRALLLGTVCDLYPEKVTDAEEICGAFLHLLTANDVSDAVSAAALRGVARLLRHFSAELSPALLAQVHRHLARHVYCKRCREVVMCTVESAAPALGAAAARGAWLRARVWRRPAVAARLYCALVTHLSDDARTKLLSEEVYPRVQSVQSSVRCAARRVLRAGGAAPAPGDCAAELLLRLTAAAAVDDDLAEAIWCTVDSGASDCSQLLDECARAHARIPARPRRKLLAYAFPVTHTDVISRRVDMIMRECTYDEKAVQCYSTLWGELFLCEGEDGGWGGGGKLVYAVLPRVLYHLDSVVDYLQHSDRSDELPETIRGVLCTVRAVMNAAITSVDGDIATLLQEMSESLSVVLQSLLRVDAYKLRATCDTLRATCDTLRATCGYVASDTPLSVAQLRVKLLEQDGYRYCVDNMTACAEYLLRAPYLLAEPEFSSRVSLLPDIVSWCVSRNFTGVAAHLPALIDAIWDTYVESQDVVCGAGVLCGAGAGGLRAGGAAARGAGALVAGGGAWGQLSLYHRAELVASLSDSVLTDDHIASFAAHLSENLPARAAEWCVERCACALVALLRALASAHKRLVDILWALARGLGSETWCEGALRAGAGRAGRGAGAGAGARLLLELLTRGLREPDPGVVYRVLLVPIISEAANTAREQLLAAALPALVATLRKARRVENRPRALLALDVLLLLLQTTSTENLSEDSWRLLREVCVLCVALRPGCDVTLDDDALVFQQTLYKVSCACAVRRGVTSRACAVRRGVTSRVCAALCAGWDVVAGHYTESSVTEKRENKTKREDEPSAFVSELSEDVHQYDLLVDSVHSTDDPPEQVHPCAEATAALLRHVASCDADERAQFLQQARRCRRAGVPHMLAQAIRLAGEQAGEMMKDLHLSSGAEDITT